MSATAGSYRDRRHSRTASPWSTWSSWSTWSHRRQSLNSELNSYSGGGRGCDADVCVALQLDRAGRAECERHDQACGQVPRAGREVQGEGPGNAVDDGTV